MAEEIITVKETELALFRAGAGAPLLVLHGGIEGERETVRRPPLLKLLGAHFEVIAPSHPGFGGSPLPDRFDGVDDLAYLYLDLLDKLDAYKVTVVGFDLGGWVAAEMAVRCLHRIAKLVLVGAVGIKVGDRDTRDFPDIFATAAEQLAPLTWHDPSKAATDYAALSDEELEQIARSREALALYTWEPYLHNPKLKYRLHRATVPTLMLRGESDGLISQSYAEAYAKLIPGARLEVIAEAGHLPQIEQPQRLAQRIMAFAG